jgi:thiol-disulfide isomerase/thioredoxin
MSNRPSKRRLPSQRVKEAQKAADRSRTWLIFVAVGVVVAVVLVVALATRGSDDGGDVASASGGTVVPKGDAAFGEVTTSGATLAPLPSNGAGNPEADPATGAQAPSVSGVTFDGTPVSINADGRPKVVLFLAHWCPHCQAEVPRIQSWLNANGMPTDVDLVAVASGTASDRPNYPPGKWLRKEGWTVPTILDDEAGTVAQAYGLSGFPFFVVVGPDGKVVTRASGELSEEAWTRVVEAARTGALSGSLTGGPASGAP